MKSSLECDNEHYSMYSRKRVTFWTAPVAMLFFFSVSFLRVIALSVSFQFVVWIMYLFFKEYCSRHALFFKIPRVFSPANLQGDWRITLQFSYCHKHEKIKNKTPSVVANRWPERKHLTRDLKIKLVNSMKNNPKCSKTYSCTYPRKPITFSTCPVTMLLFHSVSFLRIITLCV